MARARTQPGLSPLNIVTLVFIMPFVVVLCLLGVSHDIAGKPQRGGPVAFFKDPCPSAWPCVHEPKPKG